MLYDSTPPDREALKEQFLADMNAQERRLYRTRINQIFSASVGIAVPVVYSVPVLAPGFFATICRAGCQRMMEAAAIPSTSATIVSGVIGAFFLGYAVGLNIKSTLIKHDLNMMRIAYDTYFGPKRS